MKLEDARDHYVRHSTRASEVARQLAFAAIAVIWLFKTEAKLEVIPRVLLAPILFVVVALTLDFMQYVLASFFWGCFQRAKEKELGSTSDADFEAPPWINWPALLCFQLKLVSVCLAYLLILRYAYIHFVAKTFG